MQRFLTTAIGIAGAFALVAAIAQTARAGDTAMTTLQRIKATEKGGLKNPLTITPEIIDEGKTLYQEKTCSACHGLDGRGIHCPSVGNDAWVYGGDDDTLFRLIALGSEEIGKNGHKRGDKEIIAGPMPGFGDSIQDETQLWKIIAYIRSLATSGAGKTD